MDENIMLFSGIDEDKIGTLQPQEFVLFQNYPNPFNPTTMISFELPTSAKVTVDIFNVNGQLVRTLVNDVRPAGVHTFNWDGTDDAGTSLTSGIYVYKMKADDGTNFYIHSKKMTFIK
jgi:hypothetical protein